MRTAFLLCILASSSLVAQQAANPEIIVFISPLQAIGEDGKTAWISQAVQQNILHDLARVQGVKPIVPAAALADREAALRAARAAGATLLLEGSYTLADPGIRITMQVFDLRSNEYIGAGKATGALRELFALEDSVAEQVRRIAQNQVRLKAPAAAPQQQLPPVVIPGNGPVQQAQFPWDRDKDFIAQEKQRTVLDDAYEEARYRAVYTYPVTSYYGWGYGGFYRPYYPPVGYFPRPVFRGHGAYRFNRGFISVSW